MKVKRVTKKQFEQVIEDKEIEGYKVVSKTNTQAILNKVDNGRWFWHIIIFFIFPLFGNLLYIGYRRIIKKQELIIKVE